MVGQVWRWIWYFRVGMTAGQNSVTFKFWRGGAERLKLKKSLAFKPIECESVIVQHIQQSTYICDQLSVVIWRGERSVSYFGLWIKTAHAHTHLPSVNLGGWNSACTFSREAGFSYFLRQLDRIAPKNTYHDVTDSQKDEEDKVKSPLQTFLALLSLNWLFN